jgi:two-component system sensor histidine kinase YesM
MDRERLQQLRDNLAGEENKMGFGMYTVHRRLRLFFGSEYRMDVESEENQGTRVTLRLPEHLPEETQEGSR